MLTQRAEIKDNAGRVLAHSVPCRINENVDTLDPLDASMSAVETLTAEGYISSEVKLRPLYVLNVGSGSYVVTSVVSVGGGMNRITMNVSPQREASEVYVFEIGNQPLLINECRLVLG